MIIPAEDIVGCQVSYAYSAQKVFVWPYLLLRLLGKAQSIGNAVPSQEGRGAQGWMAQAQFIPAGWQVPLEPAVFQFWKEKAEDTHVNMVCCCLGLAEQYIISLTCAVLVTFI